MNFKQLKIAAHVGIIFCSASLWGAEGNNRGNPYQDNVNHGNDQADKINTCSNCMLGSCLVVTGSVCVYCLATNSYCLRSEERRVGKECRSRWSLYD